MSQPRVPPAIQQLWDLGRQLEAIKLLRQHSGLGLKEAKDLLERRPPASTAPQRPARLSDGQAAVVALLLGNPIEAVRRARAAAAAPPAEAAMPELPTVPSADSALPPELLSQDPNRAPGEQAPGFFSGPPGLLRLIALAGALLQTWLLWAAW
ncbi:MAG: hypothetical protein ACK4F7_10480 [Inhella sp.]